MSGPVRLDVLATLESIFGRVESHVLIVRDAREIGLIFELNSLWRVIRARAEFEQRIARLTLSREGRARSVCVVSFDALDASACEQARAFARERKPRENEPELAPDVFAALATIRRD